jgi:hypothetical protein
MLHCVAHIEPLYGLDDFHLETAGPTYRHKKYTDSGVNSQIQMWIPN